MLFLEALGEGLFCLFQLLVAQVFLHLLVVPGVCSLVSLSFSYKGTRLGCRVYPNSGRSYF